MDDAIKVSQRVINNLKNRREKIIKGEINCIPLPFYRFRSELPGIEVGTYYLVSGATKASKTQLTNYLFVYNTVLFAYNHRDIVHPKIFYYNLEETSEAITLRFMSFLLNLLDKIRISPTDLSSTDSEKPVDPAIIALLESPKYKDILDFYERVVEFRSARNPTGIYKEIKRYAESNGTTFREEYSYKDEFGIEKIGNRFQYYEPRDDKEYVFIIVDHVSLLEQEKGMTLRETIAKYSEYMIIFRNRYKYIPVCVQQQSTETNSLDAYKNNKIRPTMAGLSDCKYTAKDTDIMIGITNPYSYEIPEYLGYDIKKLKAHFRCMEIVLNRRGQSNGICPLYFDGAINYFSELPLPNQQSMQAVYQRIHDIENKA